MPSVASRGACRRLPDIIPRRGEAEQDPSGRRGRRLLLLAEDLVGPLYQRDQIGRCHKPGVLGFEVGIADRTGP